MFTSAPLQTSVFGRRRAHRAPDRRLGVCEDAAAREDLARPGPHPLRRPASPASTPEGGRRRERARRHKAEPGRKRWRRRPGRPGGSHWRPALAGREARALALPPPAPPRAPLRLPAGPRRGSSGAAKRPGRAGSRRKDARALGGGEVIKGKEPAAGGSGRFGCSGRCCLASWPPEGRSLEGRRCRPQ